MLLVFCLEYVDAETGTARTRACYGVFDDFYVHDHGPFSSDVTGAFTDLRSDGVVTESDEFVGVGRRKVIQQTERLPADHGFDADEFRDHLSGFAEESGDRLTARSLEIVGVDPSETDQYRYTDISELVA